MWIFNNQQLWRPKYFTLLSPLVVILHLVLVILLGAGAIWASSEESHVALKVEQPRWLKTLIGFARQRCHQGDFSGIPSQFLGNIWEWECGVREYQPAQARGSTAVHIVFTSQVVSQSHPPSSVLLPSNGTMTDRNWSGKIPTIQPVDILTLTSRISG